MDLGIKGKTRNGLRREQRPRPRAARWSLAREGVEPDDLRARQGSARSRPPARSASARREGHRASRSTSPPPRAAPQLLAACPQPDILVNNAGGPPPGDFRDWSREDWIKALDANMLTPIELIRATSTA